MRRLWIVALVGVLVVFGVLACQFLPLRVSPEALEAGIFDRAGLVERIRQVFAEVDLGADELDFENLRFFTATALNGADETVAIIPLTEDSPSYQLALLSEEEAPLAEIGPLVYAGFLPLEPCTSFAALENGVPYLCRAVTYDRAEVVNAAGEWVRDATTFSWNRGGDEREWYMFLGNAMFHMTTCTKTGVNQS